ncbi:Uncharacterised protein [Bacteroides xylanisolvens]|nr:Uncharacterised protein [Bacteroides xylanisolvens]
MLKETLIQSQSQCFLSCFSDTATEILSLHFLPY